MDDTEIRASCVAFAVEVAGESTLLDSKEEILTLAEDFYKFVKGEPNNKNKMTFEKTMERSD